MLTLEKDILRRLFEKKKKKNLITGPLELVKYNRET